ncbi:MAG: CHAT domain-containing tetratricopeptide repeat protein [Planctomycetota bacterium]
MRRVRTLREAGNYRGAAAVAAALLRDAETSGAASEHERRELQCLHDDLAHSADLPPAARQELAWADRQDEKRIPLYRSGEFDQAMELFARQLQIRKRLLPADDLALALSRNTLGCFLVAKMQLAEAEQLLSPALGTRRERLGDDHPETVNTRSNLAMIYQQSGQLEPARRICEQIVAVDRSSQSPQLANSLTNLGNLLHELGELDSAAERLREAIELRTDPFERAVTLNALGAVLVSMGRDSSRETLRAAIANLELAESSHPLLVPMMTRLANAQSQAGRYREAELWATNAIERWTASNSGDPDGRLAQAKGALASALVYQGQSMRACEIFASVAQLNRKLLPPNSPKLVELLAEEAAVALYQKDVEAARRLADQAHRVAERLSLPVHHPDLGELKMLEIQLAPHATPTDWRQIEQLARRVIANGQTRNAEAVRWLVAALSATDRSAEALEIGERALARPAYTRRNQQAALFLREAVGEAARLSDEGDRAVYHWREVLESRRAIEANAVGDVRQFAMMADEFGFRRVASRLARELIRQDRAGEAFETLENARGRQLGRLLSRSATDLVELAVAESDSKEARAVRELQADANRARARVIRARAQLGKLRARRDLRERKTNLLAEQQAVLARSLRASEQADRLLEAALAPHLPDLQPPPIAQIRASLKPGQYLLAYDWDETGCAAILVPPVGGGAIQGHLLADEQATAVLAADLRMIVDDMRARPGTAATVPAIAKANRAVRRRRAARSNELFHSLVPEDVWRQVRRASSVVVIADGPLIELPFEALVTELGASSFSYWLDQGPTLTYATSAATNHLCATRQPPRGRAVGRATVLAAPVFAAPAAGVADASSRTDPQRTRSGDLSQLFEGRLKPLPRTRDEALAVRNVLEADGYRVAMLLGEAATRTNLEQAADGCSLLHLATHGLCGTTDQPYDAGLALSWASPTRAADRFLDLDRLVRTWRGRLSDCDLVVLSACETNVASRHGEAAISLVWGFLYAGAPAVIASLWQVDDASTAELMREFYGRYSRGDVEASVALRHARQSIRRRYPDPYHWAAFAFVGASR